MTEETPVEETPVEETTVAADLPEDPVLAGLAEQFPSVSFREGDTYDEAVVEPADAVAFAEAAKEAGYDAFADLCAVDYLQRRPVRYEVVLNLLDLTRPARLLIKVPVPAPGPEMPTLTGVFPGSNAYEREAWDLMGIRFTDHPDLVRILLPEEWEGHPLRKDAPVGSVPVQFKEPDRR